MSATAMTLPGGRSAPNWWRDLAGLSPRRLWFAHLILHQVEAMVEVETPRPLERLVEAVWDRLSAQGSAVPIASLANRLSLELPLLTAILADLTIRGLAAEDVSGWRATGAGPSSSPVPTRCERRTFPFADSRPPVYVPLTGGASAIPPAPGWRFDLATLQACLAQTSDWKARHGFPCDVVRLVTSEEWRTVAVDHPAQSLLLLVELPGEVVQGYAVRADTWAFNPQPVLRCSVEVPDSLGADPGPEGWRQAWQTWSQQRSLPGSEVESCQLEPVGHRLVVRAPGKLLDRLRAARSEALKGEAWVLAGSGRVRPIAMLDFVEG